jgi:3-oxoacid CoA-transferase
MREPSFSL